MESPAVADLGLFYINLDRSPERRKGMEERFGAMPWPLERVVAIDAARDPEAVLAARGLKQRRPPGIDWDPYRYRLYLMAEEACFASQLKALRQFLDSGRTLGLILEDDAIPAVDFAPLLEAILAARPEFGVMKLEGHRRPGARLAFTDLTVGRVSVVRSLRPCAGAAAYLVTRPGAQKLINHAGRLTTVYDHYLTNPGLHGAHILNVSPWLIRQAGDETLIPNEGKNRIKSRNPWHKVLQGGRRIGLRFTLWVDALKGGPGRLVKAPWTDES